MADLLYHVAEAAETLAGHHGATKEKLIKAGGELWSAMRYRDEWPPELRDRADRICETLLADGTITTTVNNMDTEKAARTATELTPTIARLAADIATARTRNRLPSQQSDFRRSY
jgi:hypothetical protein